MLLSASVCSVCSCSRLLFLRAEVVIAGDLVFDDEGNEGLAQEVARGTVAGAESQEVRQQKLELSFSVPAEGLAEGLPGFAALEGAVLGVLFFGVFGSGTLDEAAQPALDHKRGEVKGVIRFLKQGLGVVGFTHEREGAELGSGTVFLFHNEPSVAGRVGHLLSRGKKRFEKVNPGFGADLAAHPRCLRQPEPVKFSRPFRTRQLNRS